DRAGLLAEAAIDALGHVDVIARGAARAVLARLGVDGDRLRRADRLAQLAGDAAFLAVRIAAQRMLAPEARRQRPLLVRVVDRRLGGEEVLQPDLEAEEHVPQQEILGCACEIVGHQLTPPPSAPRRRQALRSATGSPRSPPSPATGAGTPSSRSASAGHSGSAARSPSPWRTSRTRTPSSGTSTARRRAGRGSATASRP